MFDLERICPICDTDMGYRPNRLWTGMRYQTNMHEWYCHGEIGKEKHMVKLSCVASAEFKEWEKYR